MVRCKRCGKTALAVLLNGAFCKDCKEEIYEYQFQMPKWLKNANQSLQEWNHCCSPDAFFMQYELLKKELSRLAENEAYVQFKNQKPSEMKEQIESKMHSAANEMIHRFYENSIEKRKEFLELEKRKEIAETFFHSFDPYWDKMNTINQNTVKRLYAALLKEEG